MTAPLLPCSVCGRDVGAAYVEDQANGWLVWWQDTSAPDSAKWLVLGIHVACHGPMVDGGADSRCMRKLEAEWADRRQLFQLDHHLQHFAGDAAIVRLWEMKTTYRWAERADEALLRIFARLQKLPTAVDRPRPSPNAKQRVAAIARELGGVDRLLDLVASTFDLTGEDPK